jgi:hypothetical protein
MQSDILAMKDIYEATPYPLFESTLYAPFESSHYALGAVPKGWENPNQNGESLI